MKNDEKEQVEATCNRCKRPITAQERENKGVYRLNDDVTLCDDCGPIMLVCS